jgi:prophage regulatory protein
MTDDTTTTPIDRFLALPDVSQTVKLARTELYERVKKGTFPKPVKLGRRSVWLQSEIAAWMREQAEARGK